MRTWMCGKRLRRAPALPAGVLLLLAVLGMFAAVCLLANPAAAIEFMGIHRDTFPVFDDPPMLTAAQAEAAGVILPREAVIGVRRGGEARAYPLRIMGVHELGNDRIAGVPIAVTW